MSGTARWVVALALTLAVPAVAAEQAQSGADQTLRRWTSEDLVTFASEAEFRQYLRDLRKAAEGRRLGRADDPRIRFAQARSDFQEPICPVENPECLTIDDGGSLVVTAARVATNPSITNVQKVGVDEGDIVKQVGQFLLVLQDGRIFVVDTRPDDGSGLALVDRVDVYRDPQEDTWYDEMLVSGDRVLVTGYSYREEATELAAFRLDSRGRLSRDGVFFLSSNDYYDTENYATRIVEDRLVVYTPIAVSDLDLDETWEWPVVRRWQPESSRTRPQRGRPLLGARSIYRPVRDTYRPVIHTVSVCPLGSAGRAGNLRCRTTAFIGPRDHEFHVSPTDAFLWVTSWPEFGWPQNRCSNDHRPGAAESVPATLYRIPLSGRDPSVLSVLGDPIDYLSLDTGDGRFRALTRWPSTQCEADEQPFSLTYFETLLTRFDRRLRESPARSYTPLPPVGTSRVENRFTDRYLVYGGRASWSSYPPDTALSESVAAVAVPIDRPADARIIMLPHSVIRAERVGDDVVLTGYRDDSGLDLSLIELSTEPVLASTFRLPGRYESEGRSHAFNSLIDENEGGLIGLPTVVRPEDAGRWWWWSARSDISFLSVDASGQLRSLGELVHRAEDGVERRYRDSDEAIDAYQCEVSCIDWYGNARPIFTDGRVFALIDTELIEGRVVDGRIAEMRRLDLRVRPAPPP